MRDYKVRVRYSVDTLCWLWSAIATFFYPTKCHNTDCQCDDGLHQFAFWIITLSSEWLAVLCRCWHASSILQAVRKPFELAESEALVLANNRTEVDCFDERVGRASWTHEEICLDILIPFDRLRHLYVDPFSWVESCFASQPFQHDATTGHQTDRGCNLKLQPTPVDDLRSIKIPDRESWRWFIRLTLP